MKTHRNRVLFHIFTVCIFFCLPLATVAKDPNQLQRGDALTRLITWPEIWSSDAKFIAQLAQYPIFIGCELKDLRAVVSTEVPRGLKIRGIVKDLVYGDRNFNTQPLHISDVGLTHISLKSCLILVHNNEEKNRWNSLILRPLYPLPEIKK